jgi:hypothetical protein
LLLAWASIQLVRAKVRILTSAWARVRHLGWREVLRGELVARMQNLWMVAAARQQSPVTAQQHVLSRCLAWGLRLALVLLRLICTRKRPSRRVGMTTARLPELLPTRVCNVV